MSTLVLVLVNLVAISILVFGIYFPRYRRRDLVTAYLAVNTGVLAVTSVLADSTIGLGLGLGLFGVLSIIRLRSSELSQHEVAYYFTALALGLLGGLEPGGLLLTGSLMALLLATLYVGDHPRLFRSWRRQLVVLDTAIANESELRTHLQDLLDATVHSVSVQRLDLVNETTWVEVTYRPLVGGTAARRQVPVTGHIAVGNGGAR